MPDLESLGTGELSTTTTAVSWLVAMQERLIYEQRPGILKPETAGELASLLADCYAEGERRIQAARKARNAPRQRSM